MNNFSTRPPIGVFLYKYCPADTAKLILSNRKFRFSPIIEFNDPFELNTYPNESFTPLEFGHALANNILEVLHSGEQLSPNGNGAMQEFIQHFRSGAFGDASAEDFAMDLGVMMAKKKFVPVPSEHTQIVMRRLARLFGALCLSETYDNLLMWAHYSKYHTGAVIGLDPNKVGDTFGLMAPIQYREKYPTKDDPFKAAATFLGRKVDAAGFDSIQNLFFSKSKEWAYEREWRAVANSNADIFSKEPDYSKLLIELPADAFVSLHIGCRANKHDAAELIELAKIINPAMKIEKSRPATDRYSLDFLDHSSAWPDQYPHPDTVL